ncbi:hypothetical protein EZS27_021458 [termite gut metagenome]|jgi:transcriptional regulator with XRE-family HTH domain|uniref:HTH cro/C1-type domain-containing protein n=1 Tax=termite gut metagenome TaxID=433724 RepID=A0A5J4R7U3_9ZZZZ
MNSKQLKNKKTALGQQLKAVRESKDFSKGYVARMGGIRTRQVSSIEEGETNYTIDVLLGFLKGVRLEIKFSDSIEED